MKGIDCYQYLFVSSSLRALVYSVEFSTVGGCTDTEEGTLTILSLPLQDYLLY